MNRIAAVLVSLVLTLAGAAAAHARIDFSTRRDAPSPHVQSGVVAASDGFDFLTGWTALTPAGPQSFVRAVRADGTLERDSAMPLQTQVPLRSWGLSLSRGRDAYFAAWYSSLGLHAATLDSFGRVMHQTTVAHPLTDTYARTWTAWNGGVHLVVAGTNDITAAIFDDDAALLHSDIAIGNTGGSALVTAVVADGAGFLVFLSRDEGVGATIYARRVSTSGVTGGVTGDWFAVRTIASPLRSFAAASDGTHIRIAWVDAFGIWAAALDDTTRTATWSRQISDDAYATVDGMVLAGDRTFLAARRYPDGTLIELTAGGAITSQRALRTAGALATNGLALLTAASMSRTPEAAPEAMAQIVIPSTSGEIHVSTTAAEQQRGRLASSGAEIAAVWEEASPTGSDIYFNRPGWPPSAGVKISDGDFNDSPDVAWNGTSWLAVWRRGSGLSRAIVARRISVNGIPIDAEPFVIAASWAEHPRVASDGSEWVVVWYGPVPIPACANFGTATRVFAARIASDGALLQTNIELDTPGFYDAADPEIVWNGASYTIAWTERCVGHRTPSRFAVAAGTLARDLTAHDVRTMTLSSGVTSGPQVIASRGASLVAWGENAGVAYRLLGEPSATPAGQRRRAASPAPTLIEGALVGLVTDRAGRFAIVTRKRIPWTAGHLGWFARTIENAIPAGEHFLAVADPTMTYTGSFTLLPSGPFVAAGYFDPATNVQRLWLTEMTWW